MTKVLLPLLAAASIVALGQPQSVCELIAKRADYQGRLVTVRGEEWPGGHGPYLKADEDCSYKLVTRGVVWPNVINLVLPNNRSPVPEQHAPFELDWRAIRAEGEYTRRMGYRWDRDILLVTYVGLFYTYPDLDRRVNPGVPGALILGFGPVGLGAPGQLVIKTVRDPRIARREDHGKR